MFLFKGRKGKGKEKNKKEYETTLNNTTLTKGNSETFLTNERLTACNTQSVDRRAFTLSSVHGQGTEHKRSSIADFNPRCSDSSRDVKNNPRMSEQITAKHRGQSDYISNRHGSQTPKDSFQQEEMLSSMSTFASDHRYQRRREISKEPQKVNYTFEHSENQPETSIFSSKFSSLQTNAGEVHGQKVTACTEAPHPSYRENHSNKSTLYETKSVACNPMRSYFPPSPVLQNQPRKLGQAYLPLVVVAIDFGTAYSGYAFSFSNDPEKVYTNKCWYEGFLKTPTSILLTPARQFNSFGFEAENNFANLSPCEQNEWFLFRSFKMLLHSQGLNRDSMVCDISGKQMPAMTIFAMSIGYLKKHSLSTIKMSKVDLDESDMKYVLTVPSIWNDRAKQFMKEAGIKAGIESNQLVLALEPEAASIWCQTCLLEVKSDLGQSLTAAGTAFMVADLGGGTADFSVFERMPDKSLKQLHKASGGPWGGNVVNENFLKWLTEMFGAQTMANFKAENLEDYFEMQRDFERKKRFIKSTKEKVNVHVPASLRECFEKNEKQYLSESRASISEEKTVTFSGSKLRIDESIVKKWFDGPVTSIAEHMKDILADPDMRHINTILLVGGFSECPLVQNRIETEIQSHQPVFPQEPGLAVLKGAVLFGNNPDVISSRIAKYSYGMNTILPFDPKVHPRSKLTFAEGKPFANKIFGVFVKAGEEIRVGHEEKRIITPTMDNQTDIHIFTSNNPHPEFTDETGCHRIGFLRVSHPGEGTREDKEFELTFFFGRTDLQVSAMLIKDKKVCATNIYCL